MGEKLPMLKNRFLFLFLSLCLSDVYSQTTNFNSTKNWRRNKKEIVLNIGPTGFLGELGGKDMIGTE